MKKETKKAIIEAFNLDGKDFYTKERAKANLKEVPLLCQRCGKKWKYAGKADYYTSCPNCKTSVSVRKK